MQDKPFLLFKRSLLTLNNKLDIDKTKKIYQDIFKRSYEALNSELMRTVPKFLCSNCDKNCNFPKINYLNKYPEDCEYKVWQKEVLKILKTKISKDIYYKLQEIIKKRENYECYRCTVCCKFACSEFSYEELLKKASNNDMFAKQFTSIFIPYENPEEAKFYFKEYYELLKTKYPNDELYFYHCPKISDEGLCSDYENRPDICRDFPNNPLAILPFSCGFYKWREENEILAMMLYSLIEIVEFTTQKIEDAIN